MTSLLCHHLYPPDLDVTTFTTTSCEGTITYTIVITVTSYSTSAGTYKYTSTADTISFGNLPIATSDSFLDTTSATLESVTDAAGTKTVTTTDCPTTSPTSAEISVSASHSTIESYLVTKSSAIFKSTEEISHTKIGESSAALSPPKTSYDSDTLYTTVTITTCDSQGSTYVTVTSYPKYYFSSEFVSGISSTGGAVTTRANYLTEWKNTTSTTISDIGSQNTYDSSLSLTELITTVNSTSSETSSFDDCQIFTTTVFLWRNATSVMMKFPSTASTLTTSGFIFIGLITFMVVILI
ncbi:hypothetical protein HII12_003442 [Brettanomyces bruxellensis]|uniref:Uncharacterized protein n=1 Tax=Dekkera bruxellensis TaxID=5007 RepID=A0A8H6BE18_DEKBR|nr:hypothetical protein HII12_003442 [Brettanomyces bruxellensis]